MSTSFALLLTPADASVVEVDARPRMSLAEEGGKWTAAAVGARASACTEVFQLLTSKAETPRALV